MQAIFETLFDIVYLVTVITLGILMIRSSRHYIRNISQMAEDLSSHLRSKVMHRKQKISSIIWNSSHCLLTLQM